MIVSSVPMNASRFTFFQQQLVLEGEALQVTRINQFILIINKIWIYTENSETFYFIGFYVIININDIIELFFDINTFNPDLRSYFSLNMNSNDLAGFFS